MNNTSGLALVTGASAGIGAVYADRLAARGYNVVLVARRQARLEVLARELENKYSVEVEILTADLSQHSDLLMVEERIAGAKDLSFLVNNAGFGIRGRFHESDVDRQEEMHRLHVIATMRLTHAALKGMVARRTGTIVNVSSSAAFAQSPMNTTYAATKTWMNAFTEALWLELKSEGVPVKVQALCPGFTITEFHEVMGADRNVVPHSWWMSAEDVVDASLRGLERDQLIVVPGWRYKAYYLILKVMPAFARRSLGLMLASRMRQQARRRDVSNG